MPLSDRDALVRQRAFEFLGHLTGRFGEVLSIQPLRQGFEFEGNRVPLLGPQGIFKPKILDLPLSITTTPKGPYNDRFPQDGMLHYRYRGTDINHRDNVGLREAMRLKRPLVYFFGLVPGKYVAAWPVYIVGDNPASLTFSVAVDDYQLTLHQPAAVSDLTTETEIRRRYITSTVRTRVHQKMFRERVLEAYREQCALCRLRHTELLEAAHIRPDSDPEGEPRVNNGVALCKLHHAAFDRNILGIRPDYVVEIRLDVLEEIDGPMLKHGLQEMHGSKLIVPRRKVDRPDLGALEARYVQFQSGS